MTEPNFRALCAELTFCWSRTTNPDDFSENAAPIIERMKAALAQPEPQGPEPTDEDIDAFIHQWWEAFGKGYLPNYSDKALVAAALAHFGRPAVEPVPVSERLPGKKDCCSLGDFWAIADDDWEKTHIESMNWQHLKHHGYTHWLPHWAMPVPKSESD